MSSKLFLFHFLLKKRIFYFLFITFIIFDIFGKLIFYKYIDTNEGIFEKRKHVSLKVVYYEPIFEDLYFYLKLFDSRSRSNSKNNEIGNNVSSIADETSRFR